MKIENVKAVGDDIELISGTHNIKDFARKHVECGDEEGLGWK